MRASDGAVFQVEVKFNQPVNLIVISQANHNRPVVNLDRGRQAE
jgi:hypothetical protein